LKAFNDKWDAEARASQASEQAKAAFWQKADQHAKELSEKIDALAAFIDENELTARERYVLLSNEAMSLNDKKALFFKQNLNNQFEILRHMDPEEIVDFMESSFSHTEKSDLLYKLENSGDMHLAQKAVDVFGHMDTHSQSRLLDTMLDEGDTGSYAKDLDSGVSGPYMSKSTYAVKLANNLSYEQQRDLFIDYASTGIADVEPPLAADLIQKVDDPKKYFNSLPTPTKMALAGNKEFNNALKQRGVTLPPPGSTKPTSVPLPRPMPAAHRRERLEEQEQQRQQQSQSGMRPQPSR